MIKIDNYRACLSSLIPANRSLLLCRSSLRHPLHWARARVPAKVRPIYENSAYSQIWGRGLWLPFMQRKKLKGNANKKCQMRPCLHNARLSEEFVPEDKRAGPALAHVQD